MSDVRRAPLLAADPGPSRCMPSSSAREAHGQYTHRSRCTRPRTRSRARHAARRCGAFRFEQLTDLCGVDYLGPTGRTSGTPPTSVTDEGSQPRRCAAKAAGRFRMGQTVPRPPASPKRFRRRSIHLLSIRAQPASCGCATYRRRRQHSRWCRQSLKSGPERTGSSVNRSTCSGFSTKAILICVAS
jgi:hypothetical protein